MKKRARFTLIEVIIAISLTALCAPLLFSIPFRIAKKEIEMLFLCELERLIDKESWELKIDFLGEGPLSREAMKENSLPRLLEQKNLEVFLTPRQKRRYSLKKEVVDVTSKTEGKLFQIKISARSTSENKEHIFMYFFAVSV